MDLTNQHMTDTSTKNYNSVKKVYLSTTNNVKDMNVSISNKKDNSVDDKSLNCDKASLNQIQKIANAHFIRYVENGMTIRHICFNKSMRITENAVKRILKYSRNKKINSNVFKEKYSIGFATRNIKDACTVFSARALRQLNINTAKKLRDLFNLFETLEINTNSTRKNLSNQLNKFIDCYKNESKFFEKKISEIEVYFKFDKNLNFIDFFVTPNFIGNQNCDFDNHMSPIYNQIMNVLPIKIVSKSGIFNKTDAFNYTEDSVLAVADIFISKDKKIITRCDVAEMLNSINREAKRGEYALPYIMEFENITTTEPEMKKNFSAYTFIIILICAISGVPFIIAIIIYSYCTKKKLNSDYNEGYNEQAYGPDGNVLFYNK